MNIEDLKKEFYETFTIIPLGSGDIAKIVSTKEIWVWIENKLAEAQKSGREEMWKEVVLNIESMKVDVKNEKEYSFVDHGYNKALTDLVYLIESTEGDENIELEQPLPEPPEGK